MAGRAPFERLQCTDCGAHNPARDRPYCSVCGGTSLEPLEGGPLMTEQVRAQESPPDEDALPER